MEPTISATLLPWEHVCSCSGYVLHRTCSDGRREGELGGLVVYGKLCALPLLVSRILEKGP